jgi:hypothetical protein
VGPDVFCEKNRPIPQKKYLFFKSIYSTKIYFVKFTVQFLLL